MRKLFSQLFKLRYKLIVIFSIAIVPSYVVIWMATSLLSYRQPADLISYVEYKDYCIRPNVLLTPESEFNRIGLTLHTSAEYIDHTIADEVLNWDAPVSLAIYLAEPNLQYYCLLKMLQEIVAKHPAMGTHLQVHFAYLKTKTEGKCESPEKPFIPESQLNCTAQFEKSFQATIHYPANPMKNVARMFLKTRYLMSSDRDNIYSVGFERRMRPVAKREFARDPKQLLMIRRFEIEDYLAEGPHNKSELTALLQNKTAVEFHAEYHSQAHFLPGLFEWLRREEGKTSGIFLRNMNYRGYAWEPFFISMPDIPMYDENFPHPTRVNTCLRWELCRAGYRFSVADDVFMYHRGIKRSHTTSSNLIGEMHKANRAKFDFALEKFIRRMDETYPETAAQCPVFQY